MAKSRALLEAESLWTKATRKEFEKDWEPAFHLYLQATDAFLDVLENSRNDFEKAKAKTEASKAVERATKLKKAHPNLRPPPKNPFAPKEQLAIVKASSEVGGLRYPPWVDPALEEYKEPPLYCDQVMVNSNPNDTWKAALEALTSPPMVDLQLLPSELMQSIVSNCSVVASIIVCWNHHRMHDSKLLISRLYPQTKDASPIPSQNHKYHYRMLINGCNRQISKFYLFVSTIYRAVAAFDDLLPIRDGRLMSIAANLHHSLWPSLVEKAYMKYNGGYDFAGSDSGVDLRALIGWIPEHQSFQSPNFEREATWKSITKAFQRGDLLFTLGTAASLLDDADHLKLIPLHSYACIDIEDSDDRFVTVVNPWRSASLNHESPDSLARNSSGLIDRPTSNDISDTWKLSWEDHVIVHHGRWKSPRNQSDPFSPDHNHQIRLCFDGNEQGDVWALLSRHITDHQDPSVYIALHAFEEEGNGIGFIEVENLTIRGQYQQGPHCLVKLNPRSQTKAMLLIASVNFPASSSPRDISYSLVVYSQRHATFDTTTHPPFVTKYKDVTFGNMNTGGNLLQPTYFQNPQLKLKIHPPKNSTVFETSRQRIVFRALAAKDLALNIKVYRSSRLRVNEPADGFIVFDSGPYNFGLTFGQAEFQPGDYIAILSTFAPEHRGKATLEVSSLQEVALENVPQEGAGMHLISVTGCWDDNSAAGAPSFGNYWMNPIYQLVLDRATEIILKLLPEKGSKYLAINISLFLEAPGSQPESGSEIATSGPYQESLYGVRIKQHRVPAGTYLLVVSTHSPGIRRNFTLSCWSDSPVTIRKLGNTV